MLRDLASPRRGVAGLSLAVLLIAAVACGGPGAAMLTLSDFAFKPGELTARAGKPMTLTVVNAGRIDHNWVLDPAASGTALQVVLAPGERKTVTFTPKAAGAFAFTCTIPGHAQAGMTGTLQVD